MKTSSGFLVVLGAAVVSALGIAHSFASKSDTSEAESKRIEESAEHQIEEPSLDDRSSVFGVREVAKRPDAFAKPFLLDGVVAGVSKEKRVFGVIDVEEFAACGVLTCAEALIPVKFDGELPDLKARVQILGKLNKTEDGYLLEAQNVETKE